MGQLQGEDSKICSRIIGLVRQVVVWITVEIVEVQATEVKERDLEGLVWFVADDPEPKLWVSAEIEEFNHIAK